ncbi:hypothetical protein SDC9_138588 [bioreactor metagenome]|uniref:Uncharacterized protein n=1 Tax=bioreactor metagenome TaxID=1076179 RepID=A0A645DQD3_9ZZZZ
MRLRKLRIGQQHLFQLRHNPGFLKHNAVYQMIINCSAQNLGIFQNMYRNAGQPGFASDQKVGFVLYMDCGKHLVQNGKQLVFPDRLKCIVKRVHLISVHSEFRRGGEKNEFRHLVMDSNFSRCFHAVHQRHNNVQQDDFIPIAALDRSNQLDCALKRCVCNLIAEGIRFPVFIYDRYDIRKFRNIIVADRNFEHKPPPLSFK